MKEEMTRGKALRVVGDPPYFFEYTLDDAEFYSASASYGALISDRSSRVRQPRVRIRVGDMKLDNTNHVFSDMYRGSRYDPSQFPLDDNYEALRLGFWLATDRAYKQALEAFARKKASLKNMAAGGEQLPDFSAAPPVSMILPVGRKPVDSNAWKATVKNVSGVFSAYPEVLLSDASLSISQTISYLVNNEGGEFRVPDNLATFRVRASALAPDGSVVRDYAESLSLDPLRLPKPADLQSAATQIAEIVRDMSKAEVLESYSGPVLFEGQAGPQLLAEMLGRSFTITRRPVTDPERPINLPTGELEGRIGSRILPDWIDVVDDPTQKEFRGAPLFGHYLIDVEGVVPKPLQLVEKGVLKTYYSTRQPIQGVEGSNGHARIPGALGNNAALAGNLFVKATQTQPEAELRKKLIDMIKQRNKPFAIIVRKMDFPSTASIDELRRIAGGLQSRAVSKPLRIYKVFPDGKEQLIRGVRFRGLTVRTLKEIMAASDELHTFQFMENGGPFAHVDAGGYVAPTSVVSPALLFEDLEIEKIPGEQPRPPIVAPPPLTR
ncbi:MAG: metallopeptidase TldD-related protein [Bryobacteraceae bacterium]